MKYKSVAFALYFSLALSHLQAQYFSNRYPLLAWTNGFISSIQVANDTIYAMCQINDTVQPYLSIALFIKFDKEGNVLSKSTFNIPGSTDIGVNMNTLIRTNDGGFAYGGWYTGTAQNQNAVLILKYDGGGNLQWYKEIPDSASSTFFCQAFMQDSFSNYYLTGEVSYPPVNDDEIYIAKTDSSGNLIYKKVFNSPGNINDASGICFNSKGHIILGGGVSYYNVSNFSTAIDYMEIYELDTAGNPINHVFGTDTNGPVASNILPTIDGGYLMAGSYLCYRSPDTVQWIGIITKLDSNFQEVWKIDAGPCSQNTGLSTQLQSLDGNYMAVGDWQDDADSSGTHINGWILKYNGTGQIIWSKLYRGVTSYGPNGDDNDLGSIGFFSDGSIICSGEAANLDDTINSYKGWLLHLDTAGCLPDSVDCGQVPSGMRDMAPAPQMRVQAYPNPADDVISLEYQLSDASDMATVAVINQIGQQVYNNALAGGSGYKV